MLPNSSDTPDAGIESNACSFCRRRKRSCDKKRPRCSTCVSRKIACDYPSNSSPGDQITQHVGASKEWMSTQPLLKPGTNDPSFPVVYFLDHRVFQHSGMQLPKSHWVAPPIIIKYVGEPLSIATKYWDKIHWWMPIISKKRFYDNSLNPLVPLGVDIVLLLATMRLIQWYPEQEPRPEAEYVAIRYAIFEAETAGILTLQLLQAKVILTVYEFAHAIYPAAYLSVGACARYGTSLGINQSLKMYPLAATPELILEIEEKKRTWWLILLLDRLTQLGNPAQSLSTQEPDPSSYLPSDDESYETGDITTESFRASSPASIEMGMFSRMSQATFFLGRVLDFHSRNSENEDKNARLSEQLQLDRTIRALLNLVYLEGTVRRTTVCAQSSICYSSLITLHDPEAKRMDREQLELATSLLKPIIEDMTWASGVWFSNRLITVADASPFLMFWAYQAITTYRRLEEQYGQAVNHHMLLMKEKLRLMSQRWKSGEAYAAILNAREITNM